LHNPLKKIIKSDVTLSKYVTVNKFLMRLMGLMKFPNVWPKVTSVVIKQKLARRGRLPQPLAVPLKLRALCSQGAVEPTLGTIALKFSAYRKYLQNFEPQKGGSMFSRNIGIHQ
jgi:hypothetical protein